MPNWNIRMTARQVTNLSEDDVVWTFGGFTVAALNQQNLIDLAGVFASSLVGTGLGAALQGDLEFYEIAAYDATGGPPVAIYTPPAPFAVSTGIGACPSEVCIAVTRMVDTVRGPAPGGRLFIGPFEATVANALRPAQAHQDECGDFMVSFHEAMVLNGINPVLIRNNGTPGAFGVDIVSYRTDNAWDTQRRRGQTGLVNTLYPIP